MIASFPLWLQFGSGGAGMGPVSSSGPVLLDSQQTQWVFPFHTAGAGDWAITVWVKPLTITAP